MFGRNSGGAARRPVGAAAWWTICLSALTCLGVAVPASSGACENGVEVGQAETGDGWFMTFARVCSGPVLPATSDCTSLGFENPGFDQGADGLDGWDPFVSPGNGGPDGVVEADPSNNAVCLFENASVTTQLRQCFTIPRNTRAIEFRIVGGTPGGALAGADCQTPGVGFDETEPVQPDAPPDAFEVFLVDQTNTSLVPVIPTSPDGPLTPNSFINIQQGGLLPGTGLIDTAGAGGTPPTLYTGSTTTVDPATGVVRVEFGTDLSCTEATIIFALTGADGDNGSVIRVDGLTLDRDTGACCLPDGMCIEVFEELCPERPGEVCPDNCETDGVFVDDKGERRFLGAGTTCLDTEDLCLGACCVFEDGSCIRLTQAECESLGVGAGAPDPAKLWSGRMTFCEGGDPQGLLDSLGILAGDLCPRAFDSITEADGCEGACCLWDGRCVIAETLQECLDTPSEGDGPNSFNGARTVCDDGSGQQDHPAFDCTGACCIFKEGTCMDGVTLQQCRDMNDGSFLTAEEIDSLWYGPATTCADPEVDCSGACCLFDGSCIEDVTRELCEETGDDPLGRSENIFRGTGTTCSDDGICAGACCLADGSCIQSANQSICLGNGGVFWNGSLSWCIDAAPIEHGRSAVDCGGACCLHSGECDSKITIAGPQGPEERGYTEADCAREDGVFQGPLTDCIEDDIDCTGACCLPTDDPDAPCVDGLTKAQCEDLIGDGGRGGCFQGPQTMCTDPDIVCHGACCLPDGSCENLPLCLCERRGGQWFRDLKCEDNPCPDRPCDEPLPCIVWHNGDPAECSEKPPFNSQENGFISADDFLIIPDGERYVERITLIMGWERPGPDSAPDFELTLYRDCNGKPGEELLVLPASCVEPISSDPDGILDSCPNFELYEVTFLLHRLFEPGRYWISVKGLGDGVYVWFSSENEHVQGVQSQFSFDTDPPMWSDNEQAPCCPGVCTDLNFKIEGRCCKVLIDQTPPEKQDDPSEVAGVPSVYTTPDAEDAPIRRAFDDFTVPPYCPVPVELCEVRVWLAIDCLPEDVIVEIFPNDCDHPVIAPNDDPSAGPLVPILRLEDADLQIDTGHLVNGLPVFEFVWKAPLDENGDPVTLPVGTKLWISPAGLLGPAPTNISFWLFREQSGECPIHFRQGKFVDEFFEIPLSDVEEIPAVGEPRDFAFKISVNIPDGFPDERSTGGSGQSAGVPTGAAAAGGAGASAPERRAQEITPR